MAKPVLNYRFHNPNTAGATAEHILKLLLESNRGKVETMIQKTLDESRTLCDTKVVTERK